MFGLYTEKDVRALVRRLKEDYGAVLARGKAEREALISENRALAARVSLLEDERKNVSEALVSASREGERIVREGELQAEGARREFELLAEKCRLLLDRLTKKYPDEEDIAEYAAFRAELDSRLGQEEETAFDLDEVMAPKEPLDLGKLCRELGLMEDDE